MVSTIIGVILILTRDWRRNLVIKTKICAKQPLYEHKSQQRSDVSLGCGGVTMGTSPTLLGLKP